VKDFDSDDDEIDFPFGIALVICSKNVFLAELCFISVEDGKHTKTTAEIFLATNFA